MRLATVNHRPAHCSGLLRSEDSRGDEDAYEDEDGTSKFGAPLFDLAAQPPSDLKANQGHPNTHHGYHDGGLYERHLVRAESKTNHQI